MRYFKDAIIWAVTSFIRFGGSAGVLPTQQVTYLGKATNSIPWFPYGFDANVPTEFLSVVLQVLNSESKVHLPGSPGGAPITLSGEVVLYHPSTLAKVHMKDQGVVLIETAQASVEITPESGINITPSGGPVTVTGDLTVTGDVTVQTDLDVSGATALGATVTSNGTDISNTHTHSAGSYLDSLSAAVTGLSGTPV
jgi:hypothetical protein